MPSKLTAALISLAEELVDDSGDAVCLLQVG